MFNLSAIKNTSRFKKCMRGSVITGDGLSHLMFLILKGEVGVYINYKLPSAEMVSILDAGDLYTDSALMQGRKTHYTTVALADCIIMPVDRISVLAFIEEEPAAAFELIKDLAARLEKACPGHTDLASKHGVPGKSQIENNGAAEQSAAGDQLPQPPATTRPENISAATVLSLDQAASTGGFELFPEGHGTYELPLREQNPACLMQKTHTCPICQNSFTVPAVRPSKLVVASTDSDMRHHYKGIEPLYYDVLTCPTCLYSALPDVFEAPERSKHDIIHELDQLAAGLSHFPSGEKDALSVFAGYYLALRCAPICFTNYQMVMGKLYYKLSRIYQDAGDENMDNASAKNALECYIEAFTKTGISDSQEQQVCVLIGELYLKQNDLKNAIAYFSKAKAAFSGSPALKNHADNRIYEIRQLAASQS